MEIHVNPLCVVEKILMVTHLEFNLAKVISNVTMQLVEEDLAK